MAKKGKDRVLDQEMTRIYNRDGYLKPSIVLKEAKPVESRLHNYFEWNNKRAAEQHRLWQARHLITVANIINEDGEGEKLVNVPVKVCNDDSREGEYKTASALVKSVDEYQRAMDQAVAKLRAAQRAVSELEEVAGRKVEPEGLMARIALASKGLDTALNALQAS